MRLLLGLDTVRTCGPAWCCQVASRATAPPSTLTWGGIWVRRGSLDSPGGLPRLRPAAAALVVRHPVCGADGRVEHPVRRSHAGCWQRRVQQRQGSAWARASVPKPIVSDQQPARASHVPTPSRAALPPTGLEIPPAAGQIQSEPGRHREGRRSCPLQRKATSFSPAWMERVWSVDIHCVPEQLAKTHLSRSSMLIGRRMEGRWEPVAAQSAESGSYLPSSSSQLRSAATGTQSSASYAKTML